MSKVYIVTAGCYSDYHIEKVFLNKNKADKYCEIKNKNNGDDYDVEEHDLSDEDLIMEVEVITLGFCFEDLQICDEENYLEISSEFSPYIHVTYSYYTGGSPKTIYIKKTIKPNETYEQAKERLFKIVQDIKARIQYEIENGANKDDIDALVRNEYRD